MSRLSAKKSKTLYPPKTYQGRERESLVPRWIFTWIATLTALYTMVVVVLGFFGVSLPGMAVMTVGAQNLTPTPTPSKLTNYPASDQYAVTSSGQMPVDGGADPVPAGTLPPTQQPLPTYTPFPTQQPLPTYTPYPSGGSYLAVGYSYYWPPFGPPNCTVDGWRDNYCYDVYWDNSTWIDWVGVGVAVPPSLIEQFPLGSEIYVHSPVEMVGRYTVVTTCAGCIKDGGFIYFDFLDNRQRLAWTVPLLVEALP